jgi:hypothetical protein
VRAAADAKQGLLGIGRMVRNMETKRFERSLSALTGPGPDGPGFVA